MNYVKKKTNYVFNITCNRYKIIDVAKKIIKFLKKGKIIFKNKNKRVFSVKLSTKKINKILGWKSKYDIEFKISKRIDNNKIIKEIKFHDQGEHFSFHESVKLLSIDDFKLYLQKAGLKITHTFGNYKLNEFNKNSERLIIIAKKS